MATGSMATSTTSPSSADKAGAQSDLEGLAGWDSNGDGVISALDAGWSKLKIWVDANMDGVSTPGEVKSLGDLGIASISLTRTLTGNNGASTPDSFDSATAVYTHVDGTSGTAYDVTLGQELLGDGGWTNQYGTNSRTIFRRCARPLGQPFGQRRNSRPGGYQLYPQ